MALTLCSNCRLPVQESSARCPMCGAARGATAAMTGVPIAAAVALVATATMAVLARRRA